MVLLIAVPAFFVMLWIVSEFRSQRWMRLALGVTAIVTSIALTLVVGFIQQTKLADRYRTATNNLAYAVEAAVKKGQSERVISVLSAFRNQGNYDLGTPANYYHVVQSAADQIDSPTEPGR